MVDERTVRLAVPQESRQGLWMNDLWTNPTLLTCQ